MRTRPAADWITVLENAGIPCARVQTVADAMNMQPIQERNMIVTADGLKMVGNPIKISGHEDVPTRERAPDLGADGERLRREFGA